MFRRAWLLSLSAAVIAACGGAGSPPASGTPAASSPSVSPALEDCVLPAYHAHEVAFSVRGEEIYGAEFGTGRVGIVMAHEYRRDLCGWVPYAVHAAGLGYRALAFDFGRDLAGDVEAAAAQVRHDGASEVVLMGASMGGTASLVAAARSAQPPAAVVSLSGPAAFSNLDALSAVRMLRQPVLFMDSLQDDGFTADSRALYAACPSTAKRLILYPGNDHGTQLLEFNVAAQAFAALDAFLRTFG